ncbi:MAG: hypothetical protein AAGD14_00545 [Planctomycetota bacterium]
MKRWKWAVVVLLGLCGSGVLGGYLYMQGLGDARTEYAKAHGASPEAQRKGRDLLARATDRMGGRERWKELREQPIRVSFRHDWDHPLLRMFFMPIEFSGQQLSLTLRPGSLDVRLQFLDGNWKGTAWGIREGETYRVDAADAVTWEPDDTIAFQLLGYRYFFFLTFLLSEAELITDAGERELHGETYDLVYATWGQWEPHEAADQYLIWINRETSMVDFVQSTVREMVPRSIVSLALSGYREALGVRLPFRLRVLEDMDRPETSMHQMTIDSIGQAAPDAFGPPR